MKETNHDFCFTRRQLATCPSPFQESGAETGVGSSWQKPPTRTWVGNMQPPGAFLLTQCTPNIQSKINFFFFAQKPLWWTWGILLPGFEPLPQCSQTQHQKKITRIGGKFFIWNKWNFFKKRMTVMETALQVQGWVCLSIDLGRCVTSTPTLALGVHFSYH